MFKLTVYEHNTCTKVMHTRLSRNSNMRLQTTIYTLVLTRKDLVSFYIFNMIRMRQGREFTT